MAIGYNGRAEGLPNAVPCFINGETEIPKVIKYTIL